MRTLSAIIFHSGRQSRPRSRIFSPRNCRPSAQASTASSTEVPGLEQPMSMWCAAAVANATRSPWWKTGTMNAMSGLCDAPRYGELLMKTSPGSIVSPAAATSRSTPCTQNGSWPICSGVTFGLCARCQPSASRSAQPMSSDSLIRIEKPIRISLLLISWAMLVRRPPITRAVMASIGRRFMRHQADVEVPDGVAREHGVGGHERGRVELRDDGGPPDVLADGQQLALEDRGLEPLDGAVRSGRQPDARPRRASSSEPPSTRWCWRSSRRPMAVSRMLTTSTSYSGKSWPNSPRCARRTRPAALGGLGAERALVDGDVQLVALPAVAQVGRPGRCRSCRRRSRRRRAARAASARASGTWRPSTPGRRPQARA